MHTAKTLAIVHTVKTLAEGEKAKSKLTRKQVKYTEKNDIRYFF